jgi:hypothetical protein
MRKKDDNPAAALLMPTDVASYFTLSLAERENVVARARLEMFRLMFELTGDELARLETDVNSWINADAERVELFWRQPEEAVRQALRSQLSEAMAAQGLDMERLEEN